MSDDETELAAAIRQAIAPWFNYFAPDGQQPTHPERLDGASRAVLAALAGRLLPPVVETREEWAERCWRHGEGWCFPYGEHLEREPGDTHVRTVTKHADGSEHFGPWREVSP